MLQVHSRSQMSHLLPPAHLFHPLPVTHHHGQGQGQHRDDDNNRDGHTAAAAASTLPPISAATSVPIYSSASTPSSAAGAPPRRMQCSLPLPPASRIASASGSAPVPSTTQSSMSAFNFSLTRQRVDSCSGDDRSTAYNLYDCSSNGSACNGAANPPADGGHDGIDRLLLFQQQQCSAAGPELIPYSTASSSAGWNTAPIHPRSSSKPHSPAPSSYSHSRKQSQEDVTPALQIPHSILTPQLNLAQLAAEVTCLFWFESHSLLQQVSGIAHLSPHMLPPLSPETRPSSSFRKWVATILAKTQVAHNVILLALLFIYRLKKLNPTVRGKSGSEVRLLTVALMLGNKCETTFSLLCLFFRPLASG